MRMHPATTLAATAMLAMAATSVQAQAGKADVVTQAQLKQDAKQLVAKAKAGGGNASIKLNEYPNHFTMMAIRVKTGGAEVHAHYADIFYVVSGHATLLTGGTVEDPKTTGEGETLGKAVVGGSKQAVGPGDFIHIPAGTPHQLVLPPGTTFAYYVVKVRQN
jgi:mannose-6-phosphate isomerase-like protein (cupin superfamily)